MSGGPLQVLFPDGTVLHGVYNGTSDIAPARLWRTRAEVPPRNHEVTNWWPPLLEADGEPVPVRCHTLYGGSWGWDGTAVLTDEGGVLVDGTQPYGFDHPWHADACVPAAPNLDRSGNNPVPTWWVE